jgi:hypothetical protein
MFAATTGETERISMKHFIGYGLLVVAFIAALIWACGRTPTTAAWGANGTDFRIPLMEMHKRDSNPHITGHAEDIGDQGALKTFTWEYTSPFEIEFDGASPCTSNTIASTQTSPFTATCTIRSWNPDKYYYHVTPIRKKDKKFGIRTCDGCFVQIDPDPSS